MTSPMLKKLRIGIIGAGPSGIYTAKYLAQNEYISKTFLPNNLQIDLIEKFPIPHGLVRYGIAPDHQEMKLVTHTFAEFLEESRQFVSFYGNCALGKDFALNDLLKYYNSIVLAYGASESNRLGITGSHLKNIYSARDFVQWYNEYPESDSFKHPLFNLHNMHEVGIIGNGNVSLDIARMLLFDRSNIQTYSKTDISSRAYNQIRESSIRHVHILARKGPESVAFTLKEIRNLFSTFSSHSLTPRILYYDPYGTPLEELVGSEMMKEIRKKRAKKRLFEYLIENVKCTNLLDIEDPTTPYVCFHFGATPVKYLPLHSNQNNVGKYVFNQRGVEQCLNLQLVFESIGYRCENLLNSDVGSSSSIIKNLPNENGKISGQPALYTAGWLKRGPIGILNTNITCSKETVKSLVGDVQDGIINETIDEIPWFLKSKGVVNYEQAKYLLDWEEKQGKSEIPHKVRTKFTTVQEARDQIDQISSSV